VLLTDIDQRRRAEDALRESERALRLIVDSIPGLVATHTPDGQVEFVNRQLLDYFGTTFEELRHWDSGSITLALSPIQTICHGPSNSSQFTLEQLDVNEATREVIALASSDLQRHRIILHSELSDRLPTITGDRIQLQQVIANLIRNAADAMSDVHDRPRELRVTTEAKSERVQLTVRDAGVGLPPQGTASLFDAFYTTKSGGMGIGLFVSRSIIERHHGQLWAESNSDGPG